MQTQPGATVLADRYRLDVLLGRSPTGMEWLAWDSVLDRRVVVTLVDPRLAAAAEVRERLSADARALAAVRGSTLVRLLDAGIDHDVPFAVTERVDGPTLAEVLARGEALDARRIAQIVSGFLDGLAEAHAAGVLHLDPSPANVVIDEDAGTVRVRGAGIRPATIARMNGNAPPTAPETPEVDERSDVWCAGALIVRLATGRWPSDAEPVATAMRAAPKRLRQVAARALEPDPVERYQDAVSMARDLRAALPDRLAKDEDGVEDADGRPIGRGAGVFRTWLAVPFLVAIVVTGVLAAGLWLGRLELGGGLGIRLHHDPPSPSAARGSGRRRSRA